MTYDIALQTSGTYDTLLASARWAEANGLVALAVPDHYLMSLDEGSATPAYDALAQLAALARDTTTIELSVLVSPITFRHPAVLAKTALTINELAGGRFTLGIGTGWMAREHTLFGFSFPETAQRFELLEEALGYVRAMLDPAHPGYSGTFFALDPSPTFPAGTDLRLVVGGVGPSKTPRLAGAYADEYNCYPAPVEEFRLRVERARRAAVASGRDGDGLLISSSGGVLAAATRSEYETMLAEQAASAGLTIAALEAHMDQRNTPRGTYDKVAAQLAGYAAAGMRRFYLQRSADFDKGRDLELISHLQISR